jgi:hypothetical protein
MILSARPSLARQRRCAPLSQTTTAAETALPIVGIAATPSEQTTFCSQCVGRVRYAWWGQKADVFDFFGRVSAMASSKATSPKQAGSITKIVP